MKVHPQMEEYVMMVQWLRSLDAKLEAHGSNPSQGIEKEKKVCHHTTMWWCDGTLAFSLRKCDFPPNVSHSNWCASWDKASTPHMVCYSHFIFYSAIKVQK